MGKNDTFKDVNLQRLGVCTEGWLFWFPMFSELLVMAVFLFSKMTWFGGTIVDLMDRKLPHFASSVESLLPCVCGRDGTM